MVIIRLSRGGRKNAPHYKIVVADQRSKLNGRFIENVGFYVPRINSGNEEYQFNVSRIKYWLSKGAQLSDRVKSLLKNSEERVEFEDLFVKQKPRKKKKIINEPIEQTQTNRIIDNKEHKARVIQFNERIRKVDSLSDITIAEVKTIENHGEWDVTTTSSLVPIDGSSMTEWYNKQPIAFKKLNRYLLGACPRIA